MYTGPPQPSPKVEDSDEGEPFYADELAPPASDDPAIPPVPRTGGVGASLLGAFMLLGVVLALVVVAGKVRQRQREPERSPATAAGAAPTRSLAHP